MDKSNTQGIMATAELFSPPWRERLPSGELGGEYGPRSPTALARRLSKHRNWAYKPIPRRSKMADEATARRLFMYMHHPETGEIRGDVPEKQQEVYRHVFLNGHSIRFTARKMRIRRETVKSYIKRLRARLESSDVDSRSPP